ncbi:MAG TPA: pyruvate dehydrogenase complex dihydrolipoamide acetyltransferase, partial [Rhodospirillaceae bacterium]|nr:pyruvate dehydrogenase complex dihydrolipoamide acetyltransferase [Rhodospirillaceae bacterium]
GDVMAEIETDKATMEFEAVDEGIIAKILIEGGTEGVAVNEPIAILAEEGEDIETAIASVGDSKSEAAAAKGSEPAKMEKAAEKPASKPEPAAEKPTEKPAASSGDRIFASPLARRMAENEGLDLAKLSGSGPHGRIVKRDIEDALSSGAGKATAASDTAPVDAPKAAAPAAAKAAAPAEAVPSADDPIFMMLPEAEAVPHSNMRKTIAKRLTESARDIPHFTLQVDVEIDKLLAMRKQLNERDGADYKISVNDFVIKATALALTRVPDCNVAYTDSAILKFKKVDMAMAVAIDGGLITPIIKDCASKGLATISKEAKALAAKARDGKLSPEEYQGGTFTISNLGM